MAASALLFDLDGTLVDSARDIAAALSVISLGRGGGRIAPEIVRPLVSRGVEVLVRDALAEALTDIDADVALFREILGNTPPDPGSVYPEVVETLCHLRDERHPMAVVTNKPEGLSRGLLDQLGLAGFFGAVVGGDTLPRRKPDRAPLDHALALLGVSGDDALMIGDSRVDADAARAANVRFALFEGGYGTDDGEGEIAFRFTRFGVLPSLLRGPSDHRAQGN